LSFIVIYGEDVFFQICVLLYTHPVYSSRLDCKRSFRMFSLYHLSSIGPDQLRERALLSIECGERSFIKQIEFADIIN